MKKVLGLTLALALCLAGAAMACDGAKGAKAGSAGACMKGNQAEAASATCPMKGTKASAAAAEGCPMHSASAAKSGDACCAKGAKSAAAGKCDMDAAACAKMEHSSFSVLGLKNKASAAKVRAALEGMEGVKMVQCDVRTGTATVCWSGQKDLAAVSKKLTESGYKTAVLKADAECPGNAACKKGAKSSKES